MRMMVDRRRFLMGAAALASFGASQALAAVEKWNAPGSWTNAYSTATLNSIASGNAILSDLSITNGSSLDIFVDFSVGLASATIAAPNFVGVYLYPLNQDGSTYGDGRFSTSAAGPPGANYYVGQIVMPTGAAASEGMARLIVMPPGTFKFVVWNQLGVAMAATGNVALYRAYDRSVAELLYGKDMVASALPTRLAA